MSEEEYREKDASSVGFSQTRQNHNSPIEDQGLEDDLGFLEMIYRILFEPVKTFRRMAGHLPMGRVFLVFSTVKVLSMVVFVLGGFYSQSIFPGALTEGPGQGMAGMMKAMLPALGILGLFYEFVKWFLYSGILYLLAELLGGQGRAVGVLATTGLASLPVLVFLPLQILLVAFGGGLAGFVGVLIWLVTMVWGTILVVLGLRETQRISTGRAVAVDLAPAAVVVMLFALLLVLMLMVIAPLGAVLQQMGDINF